MAEEVRINEQEHSEETTTALILKMKSGNNFSRQEQQQKQARQNTKNYQGHGCFNCGKPEHKSSECPGYYMCDSKGHLSRNCFKNKGKPNNQNSGGYSIQQSANFSNNGSGYWGQQGANNVADSMQKQAYIGINHTLDNDFWVIDSAASDHMTNQREWFSVLKEFQKPVDIKIGNGDNIQALGKGNIEIETFVNNETITVIIYDVLFIPDLKQNLFSVKLAAKQGVDFSITDNVKNCLFTCGNKVIATGSDNGNLYTIDLRVIKPIECNLSNKYVKNNKLETLQLWHGRLCHQNNRHVQSFLKN